MQLAGTIKATAVKLFENGKILGGLAVQLDEASDSIFRLLRKQKEAASQKEYLEKAKSDRKKNSGTVDSQGIGGESNNSHGSAVDEEALAGDPSVDMDGVDLSVLAEIPATTV
jgi:hypothetical protein